MEGIIFGAFIGICFLVTWIVIGCNTPKNDYEQFKDSQYRLLKMEPPIDFEKEQLRNQNRVLQEQLNYYKSRYNPNTYFARNEVCPNCYRGCIHVVHPCTQEHRVFAKTPDEQKIVDLLTKATKPLDELKKEFGIKS
jgi:hypothetical protein